MPAPNHDDVFANEGCSTLDLLAGQDFLSLEPKGLVVNLTKLDDNSRFNAFVQRAFQSGCYFKGINYNNFTALLFDFPRIKAKLPQIILAQGLAPLDLGRQMLYQGELALNSQE